MQIIIDISKELKNEIHNHGLFLCPNDKTALINAIKHGVPRETVTEFADRCSECGKMRTGHWIRITNGGAMKQIYLCSVCHRQIEDDGVEALITIKYPYCHCGAKMVKPQETKQPEISSYYGLKSYVRERSDKE